METVKNPAERFSLWFKEAVLPLWTEVGYDHDGGGFFEALDFDAYPLRDRHRRVRVQARQIYVMSRVGALGWCDRAADLAATGFDYFQKNACPDNGDSGCINLLSPTGEPLNDTRDLYDQAFLLLACAWRYRAAKDERALALAVRTMHFLNNNLTSPYGGWLENDRSALPRRQNPHMHLFEALMALFEATQDEYFLLEADKIYHLFVDKFFDAHHDTLREYFTEDLQPALGDQGLWIEPGHMVEWTALLNTYQSLRPVEVECFQHRLFDSAVAKGVDPTSGFLVDGLVRGAAPTAARRLWPQTEYLKACSALGKTDIAIQMIDSCFETYFKQPVDGLWCDQFDKTGAACADHVPASILYHLLDAVIAVEALTSPR